MKKPRPVEAAVDTADHASSTALIFIVNTLRKIRPSVIASALATPVFRLCAGGGRLAWRVLQSKPLTPVRLPFRLAGWVFSKRPRLSEHSKLRYITKPVGKILRALGGGIADMFKDAPQPAFFDRMFKTVLVFGILAVGLPLALGMGFSVAQTAAIAALQIPLSLFQKSLQHAAKRYVPEKDLTRETVVKYRKELLVLGFVAAFAGMALTFSPWLRIAVGGLALSAGRDLINDKSKDLAKEQSQKIFEDVQLEDGTVPVDEAVLEPFTKMTPAQRLEAFERLKKDFSNDFDAVAAGRAPAAATAAPSGPEKPKPPQPA